MSPVPAALYRDLQKKTVFISGGASGIGAAMVTAFARQGAQVHFVDLMQAEGEALSASLTAAGHKSPKFLCCDVTDDDALCEAIDWAAENGLDILVNNAANDTRHDISDVGAEFWRTCVDINLRHQFVAAQRAFSHMKQAGAGSIINFGSVAPRLGVPDLSVYSTCKAAVKGLTRSLAREFGGRGVRVNSIVPGAILTPRQLELWISPQIEEKLLADQCLHRRLVGEDVAEMALFLASDVSSACTSQEFVVDGGLSG